MTLSFIIFVVALVLLGTYIVLKQRELSRGTTGTFTHFLEERSPTYEERFNRMMERIAAWKVRAGEQMKTHGLRLFSHFRATLRGFVVLVAAKMVRLVRGEKLLFSQTAPSLYLKRLKNEMDKKEESQKEDSVLE